MLDMGWGYEVFRLPFFPFLIVYGKFWFLKFEEIIKDIMKGLSLETEIHSKFSDYPA